MLTEPESHQLSQVMSHQLWTGTTRRQCTRPLFHVTIRILKFFSMLNKWCVKEIILDLYWNMLVPICMTSVWSMSLHWKTIAIAMKSNSRVSIESYAIQVWKNKMDTLISAKLFRSWVFHIWLEYTEFQWSKFLLVISKRQIESISKCFCFLLGWIKLEGSW